MSIAVIESCNAALGILLNTLLLHLIARYSKPQLGNYRTLLKIFASYDIIMASLHATVQPASFTSGSALGVFSQSFPNDKQLIAVASGCMSVPFTLMNINFLHRYLSVRRTYYVALFSKPKFLFMCSHYPLTIVLLWYGVCISAADNKMGKSILRHVAPEGITVEEGWLVLHFWEYGRLHIRGVVTLLCGSLVILVNLSIGATLCCMTIYHLQTEKTFSDNKVYQFKILRALFAQSAIPFLCMYCPVGVGLAIPLFRSTHHRGVDHWFMCISSFPALDAIVIIILLKDYREGAISMLCGRKREELELSSWKTNESG